MKSPRIRRPLDLQIASIAALNGLILVTSNTREFTRISGLQVENTEPKTHKDRSMNDSRD